MRQRVAMLVWLALASVARADASSPDRIDWFAFDIDLGGGITTPDPEAVFLGRVRVGYVRVRGALLSSIGVATETKDFADVTFGVAGELVSTNTGLAAHAAVMATTRARPVIELGAGWAGLRVEGQTALADPTSYAVLAFARLPLAAIAWKLWGEPKR